MQIGDIVIPINGVVLACGSGRYNFAIVANVDPFVLVSGEGDMLWEKESPDDFIVLCQASSEIIACAVNRWKNEHECKLFDADPNCVHDIVDTYGGIRCTKCKGWFCF